MDLTRLKRMKTSKCKYLFSTRVTGVTSLLWRFALVCGWTHLLNSCFCVSIVPSVSSLRHSRSVTNIKSTDVNHVTHRCLIYFLALCVFLLFGPSVCAVVVIVVLELMYCKSIRASLHLTLSQTVIQRLLSRGAATSVADPGQKPGFISNLNSDQKLCQLLRQNLTDIHLLSVTEVKWPL